MDLDQVTEFVQRIRPRGAAASRRRIMSDMIRYANLLVTAWDCELLVGIACMHTDFSYVGYLADLAVCESQSKGPALS